jgi:hypothetical protein
MALVISRAKVKDKCGLDEATFDALIDSLIVEQAPVIEYAIRPEHLADPDAGLQATLTVGATEVVAGELLAMLYRRPGWREVIRLGDLELDPRLGTDLSDPGGLKAQGWARLRRYLKVDPIAPTRGPVLTDDERRREREA